MSALAPLEALLPKAGAPPLSPDDILSRFVSFVAEKGLELYPAQEEAILELLQDKHLVLATPTGSGKSLVATAFLFKARAEGKTAFYTCPIKALVNEKFFDLCQAFGAENVGMLTGDASINKRAPIICCTAEILSNLCLRDARLFADCVVMDEFHYYADKERGVAWQLPLVAMPESTFLLMSATLGDMSAITSKLAQASGREVAEVKSAVRPVPLDFSYAETPLHETVAKLLEQGKAPIYLVNFTQRAAAEQAQNLMSVDFSSKERKEEIRQALLGARFDTPYGKELQKFLRHGVGLHHAGLLPKYRLLVEKLAQGGLLQVISGTDTLGVGVNIPIRTVLFTQLCKFDGEKTAILSVREFQQIAGRAGRKGFDEQGSVVAQAPEHVIENLKLEQKKAAGKKVVKQKPPQKGYVHWDKSTFEKLVGSQPEPLVSRFTVTHGMLIHVLQSGGGYRKLITLIRQSHESAHQQKQLIKRSAALCRSLLRAGVVVHHKRSATGLPGLEVASGLQREFSLNQTLSLFLLEMLDTLDLASPSYPLDVVSLVESILESPMPVLYAQLDRLKDAKVAELKAQGVEYEERMAELEKLEWPKPLAEAIYPSFDIFAGAHPWVGQESIRPKSIARDMFERWMTFHDYIREYGLQRVEGLLLRYLTDVYKTLVQSVPEATRTDELEDVFAFLDDQIRRIDSSLLEEWERLRAGGATPMLEPQPEAAPPPKPWYQDKKAFAARARNALHAFVGAAAKKDYETAAALLFPPDAWSPKQLEEALAPYWAEHDRIDTTPAARAPRNTFITQEDAQRWTVRQRIIDPSGEGDWMVEGAIDLTLERPDGAPLLSLRRIGI